MIASFASEMNGAKRVNYKIKITYDTGDSFNQENGIESYLDGSWNDLSIATENLNRIKEHYDYYEAINKYHFTRQDKLNAKQIIENASKQRWYAGDAQQYIYSLWLLTDDRTEYVQSVFWCGHFESLVGAELEQELPKFKV